jgi:hypothetical protein
MGAACFAKGNSNPPLCGVHNVPLVQHRSSEDSRIDYFGSFTFYVCPVSREVVSDPPITQEKAPTS